MTNRGLAIVAIRLLALYCLVRGLTLIPLVPLNAAGRAIALPAMFLALAVCLWAGVGPIANWMLPSRRGVTTKEVTGNDAASIPVAVYAAAGLLLVGYSLPDALVLWWRAADPAASPWWPHALRVAAGVLIFINAHGLARVTRRLQTAGR